MTSPRIPRILDHLRANGPTAKTDVARALGISQDSMNGLVKRLEDQGQITSRVERGPSGKTRVLRLPHQQVPTAASIPARRFANAKKPIGPEADPELVKRALREFEGGVVCGTFGLSQRLQCSHAEAVAVVCHLFPAGKIMRCGDQEYRAVVPHPKGKAA
jgi:DNA-binding MarR family transcriptional regulator